MVVTVAVSFVMVLLLGYRFLLFCDGVQQLAVRGDADLLKVNIFKHQPHRITGQRDRLHATECRTSRLQSQAKVRGESLDEVGDFFCPRCGIEQPYGDCQCGSEAK